MSFPLLQIDDLHVRYGNIHALKGVNLHIEAGEIVALIGSNGAGKTTLLKTVSGLLRASQGEVRYSHAQGMVQLTQISSHRIVGLGVAQVPEGRMIFQNLSVKENLELGAYLQRDSVKARQDLDYVFGLFPRLQERLSQNAGTLSGGEQQMLAIARALMIHPRLLLLDEPSLGIAPALIQQIFRTLREINRRGTTIFLVEQDAYLALDTAHRAYVIETGQISLTGTGTELLKDPRVRRAYLGDI